MSEPSHELVIRFGRPISIRTNEEDLHDLESRAGHPCPGCGHLDASHESGRPATILYCRDCPDGICYVWTPDVGEVGPGSLLRPGSPA